MDVLVTIAGDAESESPLWARLLRPQGERDLDPVFSELAPPRFAVGVETVYEAYLVHYARPRLFVTPEADEAILLGDYLYAHGLVRIADAGGVPAVAAMAELISSCAALRADGAPGDGDAWVEVARALGGAPSGEDVGRALAWHCDRVAP